MPASCNPFVAATPCFPSADAAEPLTLPEVEEEEEEVEDEREEGPAESPPTEGEPPAASLEEDEPNNDSLRDLPIVDEASTGELFSELAERDRVPKSLSKPRHGHLRKDRKARRCVIARRAFGHTNADGFFLSSRV